MRVLITGAAGFIGKNLATALRRSPDVVLHCVDREDESEIGAIVHGGIDIVFHLAGVNRPEVTGGSLDDNRLCTERLVGALRQAPSPPIVVLSSSSQAALDNAYGRSKRAAEDVLIEYGRATGARVHIYRLPNVFGKWAAPNYNSAVATFSYNVARGQELTIHDASARLSLVYIDRLIEDLLALAAGRDTPSPFTEAPGVIETTVGEVAAIIRSFPTIRDSGHLPDFARPLVRYLYATYLSHLPLDRISYAPTPKSDARGMLVELLKSVSAGQWFLSTTKPGVTRGNHYHHTKTEKFLVVKGTALICLRSVLDSHVIRLEVSDSVPTVVDIPPGLTHNITNIGQEELITLFWASEIFDPANPDTYMEPVDAR